MLGWLVWNAASVIPKWLEIEFEKWNVTPYEVVSARNTKQIELMLGNAITAERGKASGNAGQQYALMTQ